MVIITSKLINDVISSLVSLIFPFLCAYSQYFEHVEEAEWAVQVLKTTAMPVAASLCIGPEGDLNGVSPGDCAVRLVKAGMNSSPHAILCYALS